MLRILVFLNLTGLILTGLTGCGDSTPPAPKIKPTSYKPLQTPVEVPAKEPLPNPIFPAAANSSYFTSSSRREGGALNWPPFADWGVPETAADALSRIGAPAVPALINALQDADPKVRLQAARALARIGPEAKPAVSALTRSLYDPDLNVRINSARALGQIGPSAQDAIPALIHSLKN